MSEAGADVPRRNWLDIWLQSLPCRIGQILIEEQPAAPFALRHREDAGRANLTTQWNTEAAGEIARFDDAGVYRPLRTAPNLRHGWLLLLTTSEEVMAALDLFYPGRLAAFSWWKRELLITTSFRETLARQTGMYRVAAKISDPAADRLIGNFCRSDGGCLRTILWKRDIVGAPVTSLLPAMKFDPLCDQTGRREDVLPLLCQEACNLLVAQARKTVKASA